MGAGSYLGYFNVISKSSIGWHSRSIRDECPKIMTKTFDSLLSYRMSLFSIKK